MTHLNSAVDDHERAMMEYEEIRTGRVTLIVGLLSFMLVVTGAAIAMLVLA